MTVECPKCQHENLDDSAFCAKCGTKIDADIEATKTIETPTEELKRGSVFAGRYEIIEELGKGGMGKVYRVEDTKVKEEIALKLIKAEIAADKKTIERFRNELKIARKIRHRNVCAMFDLSEEMGSYFITMEYVSGGDLKKFIRRSGQMGIGKAISIAKQICAGLVEAHNLGIVHRDLKPNNIMIDDHGNARIMDFGIARTLKEKGITGSGVMIGTPEYMSPEQAEAKDVDQRSDIYSLGIILYEMVTGQLPFEGDTPLATAMKHKGETPKDPKALNPQISDDLSAVILKCLEKDKENRYQNTGDLSSELERIEQGLPTSDRVIHKKKTITSREITVQFSLKKIFIPAISIVAVAIITLIIWPPWKTHKNPPVVPSDKPSIAIPYFENNTGNDQMDYLRRGLSELLITDLSQSKFIDVTTTDKIYSVLNDLDLADAEKYSTEDLIAVASRAGVTHILTGSYIRLGEDFIMTVSVQNPRTGEIIGPIEKRCTGESEIRPKIDEITREIKSALDLSKDQIEQDPDKKIGELTTTNPLAYRYFIEAMDFHLKGDFSQTILLMEKATEIDPEFAMAYRFLAQALENLGFIDRSREYFRKSFELRDRLSLKERYQIEASYYITSYLTADKAVESIKKKLELYPDDWMGNTLLGYWYMDFEEWDKAIEVQEKVLQMDDPTWWPFFHITESYTAKGFYDKALENLKYCRDNNDDNFRIAQAFSDFYISVGKYDLALKEVEHALSFSPPELWRCNELKTEIFILTNRWTDAESLCLKMLESSELSQLHYGITGLCAVWHYLGKFQNFIDQKNRLFELVEKRNDSSWNTVIHFALAYTLYNIGRFQEAQKEAEEALDSAIEMESFRNMVNASCMKCFCLIEMGDHEKAAATANELKGLVDKSVYRKYIRYYDLLMGRIEKKNGRLEESIKLFERALSLLHFQKTRWENDHALFIEPLAKAFYLKGDFERAREEYDKITNLSAGRVYYGNIYVKSFFKLGQIYERQGNTAKAIEHYEKFLDLWKDADPGLPEVADAKKRLEALN